MERRAAEIQRAEGLDKPDATRLAYYELKAWLDGNPPAPSAPQNHLRGPRRTPWGTLVWSAPAEPPIEAFGEPSR
jgi:hypothetical protein